MILLVREQSSDAAGTHHWQTCHTGQFGGVSHDWLLGICGMTEEKIVEKKRSFFPPDYSINQSQSFIVYIFTYMPEFLSSQQTCGDILSKKQAEPAL